MDLIYTNARRVDQGVLSAYAFDLSFGADENDFEVTLGANEAVLESGSYIYMEGTEYGGRVGGIKTVTNADTVTYMGRTWHGILNSKVIQPNSGEDYYTVSGDANVILSTLIARLGLSGLFVADENASGVNVSGYQFHRFCKGYDGIRAMLMASGAKLKIMWEGRAVHLSTVPIEDHTSAPVDADMATLSVEQHSDKVNHLICLGKGDLADREVVHLYVDQFGRIGTVQYYTGLDEVADVYENTSSDNLKADGTEKLKELQNCDKAEMDLPETQGVSYDIGDLVGATETKTGVSVVANVTQKIVKINNGVVSTSYKTGG